MPLASLSPPIFKLSATGNDFLLLDLLAPEQAGDWKARFFAKAGRAEWVRRWCDRHLGLGADGMVFLDPDQHTDFAWDFYNSDGGIAEMCGNAARAVGLYMHQTRGGNNFTFTTKAGRVNVQVKSAMDIEVELPAVGEFEKGGEFDFVRAGVPHAVVRLSELSDREKLRAIALRIKRDRRFLPEGVNVTFMVPLSQQRLESVTFERGVEDFTLSCGTGAIAAAFAQVKGQEDVPVEVHVPGGTLNVIWKGGRPRLRGPAKVVAQMRVLDAPGGANVD